MKFTYTTKEKLNEIPKVPGVYSFWNNNELLYIGKAGSLQTRVKTHFMQGSFRDNLFMSQVNKIGYTNTASEIEALLLEAALIKEMNPKYNVLWKDGKSYFFVAITKEELPRIFITHKPTPDTSIKYQVSSIKKEYSSTYNTKYSISNTIFVGPFTDGSAIKQTLRSLRKVFPYYTRSTSSGQAKKHGPKACQYCALGLCPGPNPNKEEYKKNLKNLAAVLQGKRTSVLRTLEKEMHQASKAQQYEKAKELRDQLYNLQIVFLHAKVFQPVIQKTSIDWPFIETYLKKVFNTKKPISRIEAYDISNTQGQESTSSMPVFIDGMPAKEHYRKFKIHPPAGGPAKPNDFAMMEETISRRLKHTEWQYPDLMIIDGGKGQLSSVLKAIMKCNTKDADNILIGAIAKKNNELFLPGKSEPFLLKDMPQPVSNLILHIRDEAHRFAISYHRLLRKKAILKNT